MEKKYDESKLTEAKLYNQDEYPKQMVLPISKLKRWSIEHTADTHGLYLRNNPDINDDYLLIFQFIGSEQNPIYMELMSQISFKITAGGPYSLPGFYRKIADFPLGIDLSDSYYKLDEQAKIQYFQNTMPNEKKVKEIINNFKDLASERLKQGLEIVVGEDQERADRENIIRDVDDFINSRINDFTERRTHSKR